MVGVVDATVVYVNANPSPTPATDELSAIDQLKCEIDLRLLPVWSEIVELLDGTDSALITVAAALMRVAFGEGYVDGYQDGAKLSGTPMPFGTTLLASAKARSESATA